MKHQFAEPYVNEKCFNEMYYVCDLWRRLDRPIFTRFHLHAIPFIGSSLYINVIHN